MAIGDDRCHQQNGIDNELTINIVVFIIVVNVIELNDIDMLKILKNIGILKDVHSYNLCTLYVHNSRYFHDWFRSRCDDIE